jgi:carbon monoxide dehydrogenase subunit G
MSDGDTRLSAQATLFIALEPGDPHSHVMWQARAGIGGKLRLFQVSALPLSSQMILDELLLFSGPHSSELEKWD